MLRIYFCWYSFINNFLSKFENNCFPFLRNLISFWAVTFEVRQRYINNRWSFSIEDGTMLCPNKERYAYDAIIITISQIECMWKGLWRCRQKWISWWSGKRLHCCYSFQGCGTPGAEPSPVKGCLAGTLPAESTVAQTETPSSRRLFMYETVAYVHCSRSLFRYVRLLRFVPCVHERTCALFICLDWMMSDVYSSRAPRKLRREVGKSRTRLPS